MNFYCPRQFSRAAPHSHVDSVGITRYYCAECYEKLHGLVTDNHRNSRCSDVLPINDKYLKPFTEFIMGWGLANE